MQKEKLVIDRTKWGRGRTGGYMLAPLSTRPEQSGKMCCLGIYSNACGIPKRKLEGRATPGEVLNDYSRQRDAKRVFHRSPNFEKLVETKWGMFQETAVANKLININDSSQYSENEREARIANLFAEIGVEVEFIN